MAMIENINNCFRTKSALYSFICLWNWRGYYARYDEK